MIIWSVIMALSVTSILGTTTENYIVGTTDFNSLGAANATLSRNSNDPCNNYTAVIQSWNSFEESAPTSSNHCYYQLASEMWYRLLLPAGRVIPETISEESCGTMWLYGAHPRYVSSTPVERQLCASFPGDRCRYSTNVQVTLCSGGYYVYKGPLTGAPLCSLKLCTVDINPNQTASAICERQRNFYCSLSQRCVPYNYRCDGYLSCYYGEDEAGCATSTAPTTVSSISCGGTLYGSGYVLSPNYPSNYLNNLDCNWTLIASPQNSNIVLQFNAFSTESCCDFVSIYNSDGSLVRSYSGTAVPSTMVLPNRAGIYFTTDGSVTSSGFSIWFSTSDVSATTTISPRASCERQGNFYCASSNLCVSMGQRCNGNSYCYYGEDEAGCSTVAPTPTFASPSSCGGTLYGSGYVRSPNYPSSYGNHLNCNWTLYASPYYGSIVLQLYDFSTETCCDILSIYSNGALVNRYSGTTYPNNIVLGSTAAVSFTTDGSATSSGFSIWFSTSVGTTSTLSLRDSCQRQGYFYCALSNLCIASWRRCDGYSYCYYGEDEAGCTSLSTPSVTPSQRDSCLRQGNFYCEFSRDCIPIWRRCDGYVYCYYGEDESGCVNATATSRRGGEQPQNGFIAASGKAQLFLQLSKSSTSQLPQGSWILVSGSVTALLLRFPRFDLH